MSSFRISSRYAKALIDLAREKGELESAHKDIQSLDASFEASSELKGLFKSPVIPSDKKLTVFQKLFESRLSPLTYRFVVLMIKKGRESHLHEICNSFIHQYNTIKGITPVKLTSAVKLDTAHVNGLINSLKRNENLQTVELTEEVDPGLIGGFVLRYNDKMIDSSVKRNLHELRAIVDDDSYIKKY